MNVNGYLLLKSEYVNVPFWFIPPSMQERERNDSWWQQLGQVITETYVM